MNGGYNIIMASIHTRKSSASFQLSTFVGSRRVAKSLHTTDAALAARIGDQFAKIEAALSADQKARQATLLGLVEDLFLAADTPIPWASTNSSALASVAFGLYLTRKDSKVTPSAHKFMTSTLESFAAFASSPMIDQITPLMIQKWYDDLLTKIAPATANNRLGCLRSALSWAVNMGYLEKNPAAAIDLEDAGESKRAPMHDDEFAKLTDYLSANGESEWLTAVMIARFSGLRMGDIMSLKGTDFIFRESVAWLECITSKTNRSVIIPLVDQLYQHMSALALDDNPVCGKLSGRKVASLSATFAALLTSAGIDTKATTLPNGRIQRLVGFHSIRHAFLSWLASKNVPEDLRCLLGGHNASAHRGYVHQSPDDLASRLEQCGISLGRASAVAESAEGAA